MTDDTSTHAAAGSRLDRRVGRRTDSRVNLRMLPGCPVPCPIGEGCVYSVDGICDEPRINKGNGDAKCHRMNNRDVLAALTQTPNVRGGDAR